MAGTMTDSILGSIKEPLNLPVDDTSFDNTLTLYINSVFSTLTQLGIGPESGFRISDSTATWDTFLDTAQDLESVKSYMYYKVRLMFDPPQNSFGIASIEKMAEEEISRISYTREGKKWAAEHPPIATTPTSTTCWW